MATIAVIFGGAFAIAFAFIGGNYLMKELCGSKQMAPLKEPKLSYFYQPSEQQKKYELIFWAPGLLLWAMLLLVSFELMSLRLIWTPNSQMFITARGLLERPRCDQKTV